LKLVQDLGEEKLPEPTTPTSAASSASAGEPLAATVTDNEPSTSTTSEEPTEPAEPATSTESETIQTPIEGAVPPNPVITERKPMHIPASVHVRITPENLKDYVGPQVYQKDRMYAYTPPPGVSTGLGYLGNGSGAVMPIEAMVRRVSPFKTVFTFFLNRFIYLPEHAG